MKHLVIKDLSHSANAKIPERQFIDKVAEIAETLPKTEKGAFLKEKDEILACVKNGFIEFDIEILEDDSTGHDAFVIRIEEHTIGGRRMKTRRTKKGKRKTARRRQRGYRRS